VTNSVRVFAPAKINLFLHVGDKRADGFHALESLAVFVDVGDELEFHSSHEYGLSIRGPFADGLTADRDNLVLKVAHLVQLEADIVLTKNLPVASGIGGGSADAAATLRGLMRLWNVKENTGLLCEIAAKIGSDVPVCVESKPAWMAGRGEVLAPVLGIPPMPVLLVNPGVAVSTADVFRSLDTRRGVGMTQPEAFRGFSDLLTFLKMTANDLQAPALVLQPVIADVLREIARQSGALFTRMSGSGATCFGLFESEEQLRLAAQAISTAHPSWWVSPTRIAQ
jgi:4-diphosphocytidyl-2-C-methyl-D-erythritol kinase